MGKIFYIMGKSASGKDRIYSILSNREDLKLKKMVLYTTRPIRAGEENGKEYFFTDEHQLDAFRNSGKLIESRSYNTVHGVWTYFTADDGQIRPDGADYLGIGTLESYKKNERILWRKQGMPHLYPGRRRRTSPKGASSGKTAGRSEICRTVQEISGRSG